MCFLYLPLICFCSLSQYEMNTFAQPWVSKQDVLAYHRLIAVKVSDPWLRPPKTESKLKMFLMCSMFMCVCGACVGVFMWRMCCVYVQIHLWRLNENLGCCFLGAVYLLILSKLFIHSFIHLRQGLSLKVCWPGSPREPLVFFSTVRRLHVFTSRPVFLFVCLFCCCYIGIELGSSFFKGKYFTHWTLSTVPFSA